MPEIAIRVDSLSKLYHIGRAQRHDTLRDALVATFQRSHVRMLERSDELWALRDVSFEVKQGEVVGIIGRNGAGKSTLLKILSRITEPTSGRAEIRGRVGSLLEVGTGFHPELTGRENIFLNGAILGMRRAEIEARFAEIVAFADLERFLDTPVKRYSSGMYVRLAFAVAAHLAPEILIVDEVLAVGDAAFQKKCLGKMGDVANEGRTVLLVSHNMGAINGLCHRAALLDAGRVVQIGPTDEVVAGYVASTMGASEGNVTLEATRSSAHFTKIMILNPSGKPSSSILETDDVRVQLEYDVLEPIAALDVSCGLFDMNGSRVFISGTFNSLPPETRDHEAGRYRAAFTIPGGFLAPGQYTLNITLQQPKIKLFDRRERAAAFSIIETIARPYKSDGQNIGSVLVHFDWAVGRTEGAVTEGQPSDLS